MREKDIEILERIKRKLLNPTIRDDYKFIPTEELKEGSTALKNREELLKDPYKILKDAHDKNHSIEGLPVMGYALINGLNIGGKKSLLEHLYEDKIQINNRDPIKWVETRSHDEFLKTISTMVFATTGSFEKAMNGEFKIKGKNAIDYFFESHGLTDQKDKILEGAGISKDGDGKYKCKNNITTGSAMVALTSHFTSEYMKDPSNPDIKSAFDAMIFAKDPILGGKINTNIKESGKYEILLEESPKFIASIMRDATEKSEDASEQLTEDFINMLPQNLKTKLNEVGEELIKMDKRHKTLAGRVKNRFMYGLRVFVSYLKNFKNPDKHNKVSEALNSLKSELKFKQESLGVRENKKKSSFVAKLNAERAKKLTSRGTTR